ncbi:hypothetical protein SAMN05878503_11932 [Cereibacter ovatus]|uniref:Uncharacterized protein n=2 Tax=Cereibacter ovatus TaxID=439529 RepID=A0A285D2P7_9RHOB|nr:hypothetical protein SAMN05878503_11932 [Cereibacter ovatus]
MMAQDRSPTNARIARLVLWVTTSPFHPDPLLPPDLLDAIRVLAVKGWRLRRAGPRNHAVWQAEPALQHRLRVVIVPDGRARLSLPEWNALLRHRLQPLLPALAPADPALLGQAADRLRAALAPEWLGPGRPLGPTSAAHDLRARHPLRTDR